MDRDFKSYSNFGTIFVFLIFQFENLILICWWIILFCVLIIRFHLEIWNSIAMFIYNMNCRRMPTFTAASGEFPLSELFLILRAECRNTHWIVTRFAGQNDLRSYELVKWGRWLDCVRVNLACWFVITINFSCCENKILIME